MKQKSDIYQKKVYYSSIIANLLLLVIQSIILWLLIKFKTKKIFDNNDVANIYIAILILISVLLVIIWYFILYYPKKKFLEKNYLSSIQEEIALDFSWKKNKILDIKVGWLIFLKYRFFIILCFSSINLTFSLIVAVIFDTI